MLLGAGNGTLDVSMNAQAIEVERQYQRSIMSSFHGLFSLGGLASAAVAGVMLSFGVASLQHIIVTTFLALIVVASVFRWLLPEARQAESRNPTFLERSLFSSWQKQ